MAGALGRQSTDTPLAPCQCSLTLRSAVRFRYRLGGVEKLLTLGAYSDVILKRAREKRDDARRLVADGIDPSAKRQHPYVGSRPIASVTAQELLAALRRIEARGTHETAHRVRSLAGRVIRYAVATGRAQHDIATDLKDALAPVKSRNFASVTEPRRVGELLRAIDGYSGQPITAFALKLAPLVFVRPGELRGGVRRALRKLGHDLRDARRRRGLPAGVVAERAFTSRPTLQRVSAPQRSRTGFRLGHERRTVPGPDREC